MRIDILTLFPEALIKRPYDLLPLIPYGMCLAFVFPRYLKDTRSPFAASLIVSLVPHIATQLYMAFGAGALYDSYFNVAHGLKALAYLVPITGLLADVRCQTSGPTARVAGNALGEAPCVIAPCCHPVLRLRAHTAILPE